LTDLCEDYFHDKNKVELKAMPGVIESDIEPKNPLTGLVWVKDKQAFVWTGDTWVLIHQELTFRQFINSYAGSEEIPIDDVISFLLTKKNDHPKRYEVLWEYGNVLMRELSVHVGYRKEYMMTSTTIFSDKPTLQNHDVWFNPVTGESWIYYEGKWYA
jgi:hypothetical protein